MLWIMIVTFQEEIISYFAGKTEVPLVTSEKLRR